ncbi:MAG: FapA family protein [Bacteroidetes bacterium]|nr:FapA family protein [Bacteroidota bacterium]
MGRMLLILVVGGGMLFSIANLNMNRSNSSMVNNSVIEYQSKEAKDFAKSGVEFASRYLSDDSTWTGTTKQLNGGTVAITAQTTQSQYYNGPNAGLTNARLVTSIGTYGSQTDTIRAVIQLPTSSPNNGTPGFMNYALASGKDVELEGNVKITDDNNSQWNANVHTNGEFEMEGNPSINGFVTYVSEIDGKLSAIRPNQNPSNLPTYSKVSPITIPSFNPDDYKSKATVTYAGDKSFSGNIYLGTKANPQIIYVGGDLTLKGNVSGYGIFIVKGNIKINGNVNITGQDPSGSNLGLYTAGNLETSGNVTIKAQIFSNGNTELGGNSEVYGSITSKGEVEMEGNVNIYYKPATSSLTAPFWAGNSNGSSTTRPAIVSYYE